MMSLSVASAVSGARLAKFFRRPSTDRRFLVAAIALHWVVSGMRLLMTRGPLWRRLISVRPWGAVSNEPHVEARVLWAVKTATTLVPFGRNCLAEAVTAHWLFALAGCRSIVRIGVARAVQAPLAHAWLEYGGRTVLGGEAGIGYQPLCNKERS